MALLLPLLFLLSFSSFLLFHSPVSLFRFFFSADLPPSLSLFLLLLPFLTVQVLLSTTGRIVAAGGGSGGCGRRPRWREKQREEQLLGTRTKDDFFLTLDPPSSFLRGTLCFFWYKLSALGSTRKHPNHRLKVAKMNCQFCTGNWLVGLANLGLCHRLCCLNQPERLTLTCSQVSQDLLRVRYIQCGEETRRQMPWEGGHPTSLAGEGDEQYLTI